VRLELTVLVLVAEPSAANASADPKIKNAATKDMKKSCLNNCMNLSFSMFLTRAFGKKQRYGFSTKGHFIWMAVNRVDEEASI
jgi:hypothetical protein